MSKRVPLLLVNLFRPFAVYSFIWLDIVVSVMSSYSFDICAFSFVSRRYAPSKTSKSIPFVFQYSGLKQHKFVSHHILFSAESDQWSKNGTLGFRIQIDRSWHKFSFLSPRYSDDFLCMIIVAHHFHVQRHIRSKHFLFEFMNDFKQNIIHFTSSSTIFNLERNWLKSISL